MDDQTQWRSNARENFALLDAETAHVWTIRLDVPLAAMEGLSVTLSPLEWQRADAFRFDVDRFRFIAGRGTLRTILGRYTNEEPAAIDFEYESRGKPRVAGRFGGGDLQFNLAHCEEVAVLAVARRSHVGIDLERQRDLDGMDQIVATICSPRQIAEFKALRDEERTAAFYRLWTRKEAWLKATGNGIGTCLENVEPTFAADERPRYERLPVTNPIPPNAWTLHSFFPCPGFIAALALSAPVRSLVQRAWAGKEAENLAYV